LWLKEGDAPTRFFHIQASQCYHKNFVAALEHQGQRLIAEDRKAEAAFEFFDDIFGVLSARACHIDLDCLDLLRHELNGLCNRFTEEEIWMVMRSLPPDKAPRPDGFTGQFL
jgi:hypothetical protein